MNALHTRLESSSNDDRLPGARMPINNTPFYFLLPQQLLDTCRHEATTRAVSTASLMRDALIAYLDQKDLKASKNLKPSIPKYEQST